MCVHARVCVCLHAHVHVRVCGRGRRCHHAAGDCRVGHGARRGERCLLRLRLLFTIIFISIFIIISFFFVFTLCRSTRARTQLSLLAMLSAHGVTPLLVLPYGAFVLGSLVHLHGALRRRLPPSACVHACLPP